jgi:hypothetical protein
VLQNLFYYSSSPASSLRHVGEGGIQTDVQWAMTTLEERVTELDVSFVSFQCSAFSVEPCLHGDWACAVVYGKKRSTVTFWLSRFGSPC